MLTSTLLPLQTLCIHYSVHSGVRCIGANICYTRAPELAAVIGRKTLRDTCMLSCLWWMGEWFIKLQDSLCGLFFWNKGRLALAISLREMTNIDSSLNFNSMVKPSAGEKYLMYYKNIIHIYYKNIITRNYSKFHCISILGVYDPKVFL